MKPEFKVSGKIPEFVKPGAESQVREKFFKSIKRGFKRAVNGMSTDLSKMVRKQTTLRDKTVRKKLSTSGLRETRQPRRMFSQRFIISGSPVALADYKIRPKKVRGTQRISGGRTIKRSYQGVSVKVIKGRRAKTVRRGWIIKKGAKTFVVKRIGEDKKDIDFLLSTSVRDLFRAGEGKNLKALTGNARGRFEKNFNHEISRFLKPKK